MKTTVEIAEGIAMRIAPAGADRDHAATIIASAISEDRATASARIDELLETTSQYLEEARQARRERDALLQGFKGMAAAMNVALNGGVR